MFDMVMLVCPSCKRGLLDRGDYLFCTVCNMRVPVLSRIPRFVPEENYTDSFGLQWNRFAKTQLDSAQGTSRSRDRFVNETLWQSTELEDKKVIDAGCGAGRFSEIALSFGAKLVAIDYSSAVDAANRNLEGNNLTLVQADLSAIPLEDEFADYIYCIGVLQHTHSPQEIVAELFRCLKFGGEISLTFYEDSSWHVKFYSKYLVRPLTKRLPSEDLLSFIEKSAFIWFPLTSFLFSLPKPWSRVFRYMIPIANYVEFDYLDSQSAKAEAILDTFDMLSPSYDKPIKKSEILGWVSQLEFETTLLESKVKNGTLRFKKVS